MQSGVGKDRLARCAAGLRLESTWSAPAATTCQVASQLHPALPYPDLPCLDLPCPALPCPALPYRAPICSAVPCPTLLYPSLSGRLAFKCTYCVLQEIQDLQSVAVPEHIGSNRTAQAARAARYPVILSTYSFQLLMAFLQGSKLWLLLGIVNQHIKVQVAFTLSCIILPTYCSCW